MLDIQDLQVELASESGVVRAIDGLKLSIQRGETFALVGESGCGKSMTALALMRLLPQTGQIVDGSIKLDDIDTLSLTEQAMRAVRGGRIGMIFQEPGTSLNPVLKVGQQMLEAIEAHTALRGEAARAKAIEWLHKVGIPEPARRIDDYPFRLSGGQKQRVMIAMTLAAEPDYLVADEPTTALDVTIQKQILDLLQQLQQERGMGMLLITHDLGVVAGMADRVALMYAGEIVEVAKADDFFRAPQHPYAQALLKALPESSSRGQALHAIRGTVPPLTQAFEGCRFAPRCERAMSHCHTQIPPWVSVSDDHQARCVLLQTAQIELLGDVALSLPAQLAAARATSSKLDDDKDEALFASANPKALGLDSRSAAATVDDVAMALSVKGLCVQFPIKRGLFSLASAYYTAVDDLSFDVPAGSTLALVGESGCGKSTTGKAIVQLLRKTAKVRGQVLMGDRNLLDLQGEALQSVRREVQIIFQDPFASLNPRLRVQAILEEGLTALQPDLDAAARLQRILLLIDQVGLRREALARYPHEFSGGQRQRIAIARALAVQPKLIICDEPTSALDVSVQAQILNLLQNLQRDLGVSYLFITHNIGVVEFIADRVAVMQQGRIVEQGVAQQLLRHPIHDYTRTLLAAVPRVTAALDGRVGRSSGAN